MFFLVFLLLQYSSIIVAGFSQQLVSKPVCDVKDFFYKIQHDQVWRIKQFWIIAKEGEVGAAGYGEGVIRKVTGMHEQYRLAGIGNKDCGNY
jgi:hypothetical protein